jgi:hypothetical protein
MIAFELLDLNQFAREILDGAIDDYPMSTVALPADACEVMTRLVAERVGRPLDVMERALIIVAMAAEFTGRKEKMRRQLRETEHRLASPFSLFRSRAG